MGLFETRRPHLKEILLIQVHWWVRYTFLFPLLHAFHANWKPPWGLFPNRTGAFMNLSHTKYTMFPSLLIIDSIRAWLNLHINILITIRSMVWVTLFLIVFKERKKWKVMDEKQIAFKHKLSICMFNIGRKSQFAHSQRVNGREENKS